MPHLGHYTPPFQQFESIFPQSKGISQSLELSDLLIDHDIEALVMHCHCGRASAESSTDNDDFEFVWRVGRRSIDLSVRHVFCLNIFEENLYLRLWDTCYEFEVASFSSWNPANIVRCEVRDRAIIEGCAGEKLYLRGWTLNRIARRRLLLAIAEKPNVANAVPRRVNWCIVASPVYSKSPTQLRFVCWRRRRWKKRCETGNIYLWMARGGASASPTTDPCARVTPLFPP
jgi:hypothetical protein